LYLENTSGKILKQTSIVALTAPESCVFKPITSILLALKSGIVKKIKL